MSGSLATAGGRPNWDSDDPSGLRALFECRRAAYALARMRFRGLDEAPADTVRRLDEALRSNIP